MLKALLGGALLTGGMAGAQEVTNLDFLDERARSTLMLELANSYSELVDTQRENQLINDSVAEDLLARAARIEDTLDFDLIQGIDPLPGVDRVVAEASTRMVEYRKLAVEWLVEIAPLVSKHSPMKNSSRASTPNSGPILLNSKCTTIAGSRT